MRLKKKIIVWCLESSQMDISRSSTQSPSPDKVV